jgi:hypothetical protein
MLSHFEFCTLLYQIITTCVHVFKTAIQMPQELFLLIFGNVDLKMLHVARAYN